MRDNDVRMMTVLLLSSIFESFGPGQEIYLCMFATTALKICFVAVPSQEK